MAIAFIKKVAQAVGKKIKNIKPKKIKSKNIGVGKIKQDKLYNVLGTDKYGKIKITNTKDEISHHLQFTISYRILFTQEL